MSMQTIHRQRVLALVFLGLACRLPAHAETVEIAQSQLTLISDVEISAQVAGYVQRVAVQVGDRVVAGNALATLNDELILADLEAARGEARVAQIARQNDVDLRYAEKTRGVNQQELLRSRRANERFPKTVSESELQRLQLTVDQASLAAEQAQRDLETAQAQLDASQSAVAAAAARLKYHKVVAPSAGLVVRLDVQPGTWVNPGDAIARVIRMDTLRVEALVDGNQHGDELVGRNVVFRFKGGRWAANQREHDGRVVFVSPELHPVTGMVRVWGEIDNVDRVLRPGMTGTLTIE